MKRFVLILFAVTTLVQLTIPAWMIQRREAALKNGDVFHFKTQPVDPYDAFRGRYVALAFDVAVYSNRLETKTFDRKQRAYAKLVVGDDGFAKIESLHDEKLDEPCIPVRVQWSGNRTQNRLTLPMDRFYLEESLAPEAEKVYRLHSRRGATNTYAVVRVKNAFPVIEDLIIDGRSVYTYGNP